MVKFEMIIAGTEDIVLMNTASPTIGSTEVGPHFATFSGNGELKHDDYWQLKAMAEGVNDETDTVYEAEIDVGPKWKLVNQCSFIVAPAVYSNSDADEDDMQSWQIRKNKWDLAPAGGKKRIRLSFTIRQNGQATVFSGIVYQGTATGIL